MCPKTPRWFGEDTGEGRYHVPHTTGVPRSCLVRGGTQMGVGATLAR